MKGIVKLEEADWSIGYYCNSLEGRLRDILYEKCNSCSTKNCESCQTIWDKYVSNSRTAMKVTTFYKALQEFMNI